MRGFIFSELQEFVHKNYGIEQWFAATTAAGIDPEKYDLFEDYSLDEFGQILAALSVITKIPFQDLMWQFGSFSAPKLWRICSRMIPPNWSYADMLENLPQFSNSLMANALTGVEAKKTLTCQRDSDRSVTITYHSPRKLCSFGKGVLISLASQYDSELKIEEPRCMLKGDEACEMVCHVSNKKLAKQ